MIRHVMLDKVTDTEWKNMSTELQSDAESRYFTHYLNISTSHNRWEKSILTGQYTVAQESFNLYPAMLFSSEAAECSTSPSNSTDGMKISLCFGVI